MDKPCRDFFHRDRSANEYRTEATVRASDGTAWNDPVRLPFRFEFHTPYWIAVSIYLPPEYVADSHGMSEVLFQVHNSPDEGEGYTNPMVAIEVDSARWKIYSRWSDDVPTRKNVWDEVRVIDGGDMTRDRGTWVDWVVHAEFSWASSGFLAVYRNQVLVDSISGPTSTQDAQGSYVKFGIYKWTNRYNLPAISSRRP